MKIHLASLPILRSTLPAAALLCFLPLGANGQTNRTWDTALTTGSWNLNTNWSGDNVPDTTSENAVFAADSIGRTVSLDTSVGINAMTIIPRSSGFAGQNFTLNTTGGAELSLQGGLTIDNGNTVSVNPAITLTGNQTWSGGTNTPGGAANFNGNITGAFQITRSATNNSGNFTFLGTNTFSGGFQNSSGVSRIGAAPVIGTSITSSAFGTGTLTLNGGTISSNSGTSRTVYNNTVIGGNVTLGQTSGGTGTLVFASDPGFTTPTTFQLSGTTGTVRTITTSVNTTVSKGITETVGTGLGLTKAGSSSLTLSGENTYTGNTTVSAGTLTLTSTSSQLFAISDSSNTQILGSGAANFNGAFKLDLSGVSDFTNSWTLVDVGTLTETFNATTFSILDNAGFFTFTETANVWNATSGGVTYSFEEATGILTVVPEPSSFGMIVLGFALLLGLQRKRSVGL